MKASASNIIYFNQFAKKYSFDKCVVEYRYNLSIITNETEFNNQLIE